MGHTTKKKESERLLTVLRSKDHRQKQGDLRQEEQEEQPQARARRESDVG